MYQLDSEIKTLLAQRSKRIIPVVEFYPRKVDNLTTVLGLRDAIGRFSTECFDWETSAGTYNYIAKVNSFPSIKTFISEQLNHAEVEFSNVQRGEGSMARFVLNNHIKGMWMVIRLVFPDLEDASVIVFWGKCERPGGINTNSVSITATQDLGNHGQKIPFRTYGPNCPLEFAKPGGGCLGNQTLAEKDVAYQEAVSLYGTAGCNKLFSTCAAFNNTNYFQGQRVVAVSGSFSYVTVEEVVKRVLFWTKRKKISVVKTDSWSSVNQSEGSEVVPVAFGRCQIEGHPFVWADVGEQVRGLYGFCEGRVSGFNFTRSRTEGINILSIVQHLGDWGGVGTQTPDLLFSGVSGTHSRLAYLEITTGGSSPTQVDDAPLVTSVIRAQECLVPNENGEFLSEEFTDNPVAILWYLLTDSKYGRISPIRLDQEAAYETYLDCTEIVEDRTNEETLVLPSNEFDNYDIGYRRYRSSGRYSAYKDMYRNYELQEDSLVAPVPEFEDPEIRWFNPFQPYTIPVRQNVLRQKYTFNGALQEETSLFDFISKRVLPTFKGYLNYGFNGKLQIKNRRKADNAYLRAYTDSTHTRIPVTNIAPWRNNRDGFLVIGVGTENAEIRTVEGFEYSTACNNLPISITTTGDLTVNSTHIIGATKHKPGEGFIEFGGTVTAGDKVTGVFDTGDNEFEITYTADGVESIMSVARMFAAFLNANVQFHSYLTAYILPNQPSRVHLRCEVGNLLINKPTEFPHDLAEEIMRVQGVFENCAELTANTSAQFDNIIDDSFKWNESNTDDINAVTAKYTSAVDDFRTSVLMPRAAWDTIDLEGELVKEEIDLSFVDNYWQAAYLAKGEAIDRIDGNIHFAFDTGMQALGLELGDVVAVRHDSGDGALNYVPVWITGKSINLRDFQINIEAKLYLSAAFDYHVQPVDALLTTTLNTTEFPEDTPPTTGTNGGVGGGTEPELIRPDHGYYEQFRGLGRYSPDGKDII